MKTNTRANDLARGSLKTVGATVCGGAAYFAWLAGDAILGPLGHLGAILLGGTAIGLGASAAKDIKNVVKKETE